MKTRFTEQVGIEVPLICGAMYPCSNPELVAAVSEAGGIGIVQPLSMVYVHGHDFREGLKLIRNLTNKPFGVNILIETSSRLYEKRMRQYLEISLEEGCRFFITALGNPKWVVDLVKPHGGIVYHDATERKWALKGLEGGIDGLICVNNSAGGHAGKKSIYELHRELADLNIPLIAAGGIGDENDFVEALQIGYDGVQMGTRFIAAAECFEKEAYKQAICNAESSDIVLTERVTGIPLSVINTPYVQKIGTKVNPITRFLLQNHMTKHWMRMWWAFKAFRQFKRISREGGSSKDYWQAGKSVGHIKHIEIAAVIVGRFKNALIK
jgi:nitronate monooxygenase